MDAKEIIDTVLKAQKDNMTVEVYAKHKIGFCAKFEPRDDGTIDFIGFHDAGCIRVNIDELKTVADMVTMNKKQMYVTYIQAWNVEKLIITED